MSDAQQSELELRALQRVIASGERALDLEVVLDRCLEQAMAVAGAQTGLIYLREEERHHYRLAQQRNVDDRMAVPTVAASPFDERINKDHMILDLRAPSAHPARALTVELGFTHALYLVLRVDHRRVGFVGLCFRAEPQLSDSTLRTLEAIFAFEAVALESARGRIQVERRARLARTLIDGSERLLGPDADARALLADTARAVAGADHVAWTRLDRAAATAPLVVEDVGALPADHPLRAESAALASLVLLDVRAGEQLLIGSRQPRAWDAGEIEALQLLASIGAQALERARRTAEEREQHQRTADILEHLPLVVAIADRSGRIVHINAAGRDFARRMGTVGNDWRAGLAAVEVYDRAGNFVPIEERGMLRAFGGATTDRELTLVSPNNGQRMHIRAVSAPIVSPDGSIGAVQTSFQDVTELREMADAKDRFLSIASHELRSPITSLRATTTLLQIDPAAITDEARRQVLLGRIQRQVDRLSTLVERLLDTTRLNAGELPLDWADGDMGALCRDAIDLMRMTDRDHVYTIDLGDAESSSLAGRWDLARIEQVLSNLLSNASRYSPAGREIRVVARGDGERVTVDVVDRGAGIAADEIERLFTPFYRGAGGVRHKGGLGLGLYITREIVRRHGGTMRVASTPGEGSTFTVELPRRPKMG